MKSLVLPLLALLFVSVDASAVEKSSSADELPEKLELRLDFTMAWPFNESPLRADLQAKIGDRYVGDPYTFTDYETLTEHSFFIRGNAKAYGYARANFFDPGSKNARITLPAIMGMRLMSVTMEVKNGPEYPKGFKIVRKDYSDLAQCRNLGSAGTPAVLEFPTVYGEDTEVGRQYYMNFTSPSTQITCITLVYVR